MAKASKNRASKRDYSSPQQLILTGFESPFSNQLVSTNRWVILSNRIPWDNLVSTYNRQLSNKFTGAGSINPRVAIGALIIKHPTPWFVSSRTNSAILFLFRAIGSRIFQLICQLQLQCFRYKVYEYQPVLL